MKPVYTFLVCVFCLSIRFGYAQTAPFTGTWSFEGTPAGTSSNSLISVSPANYINVEPLNINGYSTGTGYVNKAVNLRYWSMSCDNAEYVEFTAQPLGTAKLTVTSLSFAFSRSDTGPQQLTVRSSVDGFSSELFSGTVNETYQHRSIPLDNPGFVEQTSPITFRIYGCKAVDDRGRGTLHLDEIQLNGQSLPVTLVSLTAKLLGDAVQLSWATTAEQNADRFEIQRSRNLGEFITVGQVAATGTTNQQHHYGFTDPRPLDGTNYYRLKQVDIDGRINYSKFVSVVMDDITPSFELLGNPTDGSAIHISVRNLANAIYGLTTLTGRELLLKVENQADGSLLLLPDQPLVPGIYLLRASFGAKQLVQKVLVR